MRCPPPSFDRPPPAHPSVANERMRNGENADRVNGRKLAIQLEVIAAGTLAAAMMAATKVIT